MYLESKTDRRAESVLERKTRFELATLALARRCSTTELLPRTVLMNVWSHMGEQRLEL